MEYISLHRYIRNTPSDIEVHAQHQLRAGRSTWPAEKNVQTHAKLGKNWSVSRTEPALSGRGTEAGGQSPHRGSSLSQRRNI